MIRTPESSTEGLLLQRTATMETAPPSETQPTPEYDPTFLHSRREAAIIFGVWAAALVWTIPYCYFNGYTTLPSPDALETVWGVPSWVFWGVAFPWLLADLFTVWFCFFYMADDDLGDERPAEAPLERKSSAATGDEA